MLPSLCKTDRAGRPCSLTVPTSRASRPCNSLPGGRRADVQLTIRRPARRPRRGEKEGNRSPFSCQYEPLADTSLAASELHLTHFVPTWNCSIFRLKQPVQDQYASAACAGFEATERCLQGRCPGVGSDSSGRRRLAEVWDAGMTGHPPRRQVPDIVAESAEMEVP